MMTPDQLASYHRDGYVIVPRLFDPEEINLLGRIARADRELDQRAGAAADGEGGKIRLTQWNHPGDDIYGMFARGERLVGAMEQLLDGEVYHYHSKMILKDARVGGAWAWHQDYGYWYNNAVLFPDLASVMIAVDPSNRANGCLQVLKGSHRLGRVDHGKVGDQTGADPERVEEAKQRLELVYCEMQPGDAVFFHCNTLHRSDQNKSDQARWTLICCYNAARNNPYRESVHPRYTPLHKVPDGAVKTAGRARLASQA